jgi:hypothetical protein
MKKAPSELAIRRRMARNYARLVKLLADQDNAIKEALRHA